MLKRPAFASCSINGSTVKQAVERTMLKVESEREEDGRWIAEVTALPGVLTYGETEAQARAGVQALALRVIADRLENGEPLPREIANVFEAARTRGRPQKHGGSLRRF
jgi:predicted RNase H-like HicB family nuclease